MVRRSGATRYRQGTRNGGARKRRRSNLGARVRYQRPTAGNQKRQIQSLARLAMRSSRILRAHRIFQDWTVNSTLSLAVPGQWAVRPLMDPINWNACLRQDLTPLTQSGCYVRELQLEYFLANGTKLPPSTISLFVVTLRRNQNWDGSTFNLNDEFIPMGEGSQPILNSGIFSVKWARTFQIFNLLQDTVGTGGNQLPSGQPTSSYKKGKTTIRINTTLRSPSDASWKQLGIEDMPYYNKMYLLAYFQNEDPSSVTAAQVTYGYKVTTITQD